MKALFRQLFPTPVMKVLLFFYLATLGWWISIFARGLINTVENYLFDIPLGLLPFGSGIFLLIRQRGLNKKNQRWFACFLAFGLVLWGSAAFLWVYYNTLLQIPVPYPSFGDFFYVSASVSWVAALIFLVFVLGLWKHTNKLLKKIIFFLFPILLLSCSYFLLFEDKISPFSSITLVQMLNFFYPFADVCILLLGSIIVYVILFQINNPLKVPILVLSAGFVLNYIADLIFTYSVDQGIFYVAGPNDFFFLSAMFVLSLGGHLVVKEFKKEYV